MTVIIIRIALILFLIFVFNRCSVQQYTRGELPLITREDWGSEDLDILTEKHQIKRLTIHHGGVYFEPQEDPVQYLKNLQAWSRAEKNWPDIPYHYLIDMQGKIYEARPTEYPGDTNTNYDPRGHLLVCVIGNYEEQEFLPVQYESLVNFLKFFADIYEIPLDSIRAHKDYTETLCPGKNIYRYIESGLLIKDIKKL